MKILNGLSIQIFKQNLSFFIIQDCVNQGKKLFYLKILLGNNFPQFDKSPGKYTSKTCQIKTKNFLLEDISVYNMSENSRIITVKATYKMELFLTLVIASSCGLLPQ